MTNKRLVVLGIALTAAVIFVATTFAQPKSGPEIVQASSDTQAIKVLITKKGFEPGNLNLKPNVPAKITFLRQTNDTCATSVVISEYKIKKDLPLNEPVVVEFKPTKTGKFSFSCGMYMLKGDLIVSEQ